MVIVLADAAFATAGVIIYKVARDRAIVLSPYIALFVYVVWFVTFQYWTLELATEKSWLTHSLQSRYWSFVPSVVTAPGSSMHLPPKPWRVVWIAVQRWFEPPLQRRRFHGFLHDVNVWSAAAWGRSHASEGFPDPHVP